MPTTDIAFKDQDAPPSLVNLTYLIYALHAVSLIIGLSTAATVIGAFVFGWPSIIAVILNYMNRSAVADTILESHFLWQIRTFWYALLWLVLGFALIVVLVGFVILALTGLWAIYRIARGMLALSNREPIPA